MCGNDVSTIVQPEGGWRTQISNQVSKGKIKISNYRITMSDAMTFRGINTANVREIQFTKCDLDHQKLQILLKNNLSSLTRLVLSNFNSIKDNNKIGPVGCRILASSEILQNLKSLQLNNNKIKDSGIKALSTGYFSEIEDISLNDNQLTIDGVSSLKNFSSILYLALSGNKLNDSGVGVIKEINSDGLVFLCLSRNDFTDKSVEQLMEMDSLEVLMLDRNKVKRKKGEITVPKSLFLFF